MLRPLGARCPPPLPPRGFCWSRCANCFDFPGPAPRFRSRPRDSQPSYRESFWLSRTVGFSRNSLMTVKTVSLFFIILECLR